MVFTIAVFTTAYRWVLRQANFNFRLLHCCHAVEGICPPSEINVMRVFRSPFLRHPSRPPSSPAPTPTPPLPHPSLAPSLTRPLSGEGRGRSGWR
eukprot:8726441-Pyramimonas_sp.AAC.1